MPQFPVGDTKMLVSKIAIICVTPNVKPKIYVTPNPNPKCESVEYRLGWVSWHWGLCWACTFQVVCVNFICVRSPTQMWHSFRNMGFKIVNFKLGIHPELGS